MDEEYEQLYEDFLATLEPLLNACKHRVMRHAPYYYAESDKTQLPYKTGNMTWNAFKVIKTSDTSWDVVIDIGVAPYASYLDDPRKSTAGWWKRVVYAYIQELQRKTHGQLKGGN